MRLLLRNEWFEIVISYLSLIAMFFLSIESVNAEDAPASSNNPGAQFPLVHSDRKVTFQVNAPNAQKVQVVPGGNDNGLGLTPFDMVKNDRGQWTVTTPPAVPGFHYYWLMIDGAQVNDPASQAFFGYNRDSSGIEIPDTAQSFYDIKDVPHGEVRSHWYHSEITNMWRKAVIYTPPGYDSNTNQRYPVLYLQHGSGENERGWTTQGRANFILDNLLAERKIQSMIVVMENGMIAPRSGATAPTNRRNEAFADVVVRELIPNIDSTYRTMADREHRAMAGLSMGAGQAMQIGFNHLDKFAYIGAFSGGGPQRTDLETLQPKPKLVWIGAGSAELARVTSGKTTVDNLTKAGIGAAFYEAQGTSHEWQTWRYCLREFAQKLFH